LTVKKEKKSMRKKEDNDETGNGNDDANGSNEDDDEIWSADVSEAAVKQRMKELSLGVKGLAMDDDVEKSENERMNIVYDYVKVKAEATKGTKIGSFFKNSK
jgi:translation initiation factor 5